MPYRDEHAEDEARDYAETKDWEDRKWHRRCGPPWYYACRICMNRDDEEPRPHYPHDDDEGEQ